MLHLDNLPRVFLQCKGWWPLGSQNTYICYSCIWLFFFCFSVPFFTPPPPPTPPHSPRPHPPLPAAPPPPPSPQVMQFCDLCYVDAQKRGFVGLGINAFPGWCVHYFCVPFCVCWYEHSLKSNKPFESLSLWVSLSPPSLSFVDVVLVCLRLNVMARYFLSYLNETWRG